MLQFVDRSTRARRRAGSGDLLENATTTAFALAGLGGLNAHGAGFLAAASKCTVVPDLVTATSGQIIVLAEWLQGKDLEKSLVDPKLEHNSFAQLSIAFAGDPGVFRPAYLEALKRWWSLPSGEKNPFEALFDRLLPAQMYVPTRSEADFENIARTLNNATGSDGRAIGVVFNAYNLNTGQAVLFGNDKARKVWPREKRIHGTTQSVDVRSSRAGREELPLRPITAQAVESALWLSLYGFAHLPQPHLMDGAYHRACIVSELHEFDRIFVARPLAQGWLGKAPSNWFEVQDWQTEMWFSAGYKAEVDALRQINGLVAQGRLAPPYKQVDLVEIAPPTPVGFFNYFIERKSVYERAYAEAMEKFGGTPAT
jgi:hypothetical protein